MFWNALVDGCAMMFHWQIWVAMFLYGMCFLLYYFLLGSAMAKGSESGTVQFAGCLTNAIGGPILQGILVAFMVTALLPILSGGHEFMPSDFITDHLWRITKVGVLSMGIVFVLIFIPIVGSFIAQTPGTAIFIQGAIVFRALAGKVIDSILNQINPDADIFPGFWVSVGFLIFSMIVVYAFTFGIMYLLIRFEIVEEETSKSLGLILGNFIGVVPGVLTLCVYCSYVRLNMMSLEQTIGS